MFLWACAQWDHNTLPRGIPILSYRQLAYNNRLAGKSRSLEVGDRITYTNENEMLFVPLDGIPLPEVYKHHEQKIRECSSKFSGALSDQEREEIARQVMSKEMHMWSGVCVEVSPHGEWAKVKFEDIPTVYDLDKNDSRYFFLSYIVFFFLS